MGDEQNDWIRHSYINELSRCYIKDIEDYFLKEKDMVLENLLMLNVLKINKKNGDRMNFYILKTIK